jgi:hypothetical protein
MAKEAEFFNLKYREGSLDPKTAQLILMAVNFAIGHEHGAKLHLDTIVYCMRPVAAKVRNFAKEIIAK